MVRTQILGGLGVAAPAGLERALQWLASPQDGPQIVLLGVVVACGLLGLAWRGRHRRPGA
ncbi:hypothetical protein OV090_48255 [Nannocystis sp. RBIL2]|uniref:hypothetical protein n=1 Tax=Nannocystis sp. RBIL2 TaxID=2996788 RepID=UPI0022718DD1|nr:hypothetical protein [Nannocystis sp. RBIL2]